MPSLRLKIQYNKNEGLLISPSELRETYLFGIPVCTTDGRELSSQSIKQQIVTAQKKFERLFSIKINRQVIEENRDFIRQEWEVWGYVKYTYPIVYPDNLKGYISEAMQVNFPKEWLSMKRTEAVATWRNLYLIPNSSAHKGAQMTQNSIVYNGILPALNYLGRNYIPNYWRLKYITGWKAEDVPDDLTDVICKYAAINVLSIVGSYLYGTGISSWSVSLDGVSQSTPFTKGGKYGMFNDRITLYLEEINAAMQDMKYLYSGIVFDVL